MSTITREAKIINMKTAILDAERMKKPIKIDYRVREFESAYKVIDTPKTLVTDTTMLHGDLLYWKYSRFEWRTIGFDFIDRIEIDGKAYTKH